MDANNPLFKLMQGVAPAAPPPIKQDTPHFEALGRFIASYANAETVIQMLARKVSGLSDEKARVIFAGMRLPDITDKIRGLMRIDGEDTETFVEVDTCLIQLSKISNKRHNLVHRSTNYAHGKLLTTNILTAKSTKAIESDVTDHAELAAMQSDCITIYLRLDLVMEPTRDTDPVLRQLLFGPWRYKPEPPKPQNQERRATPKTRKRQPGASQT